ncbi:hypothetical protein GW846_05730 [Candidatus Gracilibacteria bacterium]|nr:hypothetical protein [Candidatus Gracilibacteria bacterium]
MQRYLLKEGNNSVAFYPERGGIITSLILHGDEILYQDLLKETLFDDSKSVRGGVPILFPQAGPISEIDSKEVGYHLPQHGVLRQRPWKLKHITDRSVEMSFESDARNTEFPFSFEIECKITLIQGSCSIIYTVINTGETEFPLTPGLHPYFKINNKLELTFSKLTDVIQSKIHIWANNGTISLKNVSQICISEKSKNLTIESLGILNDFWIWSMKDKDFICIEPVYGDEGSLIKNPYNLGVGKYCQFGIQISRDF